jgi:hypothetical protein
MEPMQLQDILSPPDKFSSHTGGNKVMRISRSS